MSNSSKHLNKKNVTEIRLQNPVVNDGSGQSIYPIQNLVQMKGICTLSWTWTRNFWQRYQCSNRESITK